MRKNAAERRFSGPVVAISVTTIALSLAVMLMAVSIVSGFQNGITEKVTGISAHIRIAAAQTTVSYESVPFISGEFWESEIKKIDGVKHVQRYATKLGIVKTDNEIQGALVKGVGPEFDWHFFASQMEEGQLPESSQEEVLISSVISRRLRAGTGDTLSIYYIERMEEQARPRVRKLHVSGIYNTGMPEIDQGLILTGLHVVQEMYAWDSTEVSGLEVVLNQFEDLSRCLPELESVVPYNLITVTIQEEYPDIFYWLPSLDQNAVIIIGLMIVVSLLAMSTTLLILILERTHTIGVLKTLGMNNWDIRKIFLIQALHIIFRGILAGNLVGMGLLAVQHFFKLVRLPKESYYLDSVPVEWMPGAFLTLNLITVGISMAVLVLPSWLVSRLHPVQAIRID